MRKGETTPWVLGAMLGLLGAAAGWLRAWRAVAHRRRITDDLARRIIALEEALAQTQEEVEAQKQLADRRRAEHADALAREERLRAEFTALQRREAESAALIHAEAQLALFERLAGPLVQLPTVQRAVAQGNAVSAGDVLALIDPLRQAMLDMGFVPIGEPGAETAFDPRLHQCGDDAALDAGQPVQVKFVGYRRGEHILRRAQVTPL